MRAVAHTHDGARESIEDWATTKIAKFVHLADCINFFFAFNQTSIRAAVGIVVRSLFVANQISFCLAN